MCAYGEEACPFSMGPAAQRHCAGGDPLVINQTAALLLTDLRSQAQRASCKTSASKRYYYRPGDAIAFKKTVCVTDLLKSYRKSCMTVICDKVAD